MIRLIKEVPERGLTEGIIPLLVKAMPALVSGPSEISAFEPIAKGEIPRKVIDFEGTKVFVFDLPSLFKVKVRFGEITVEPRSPAAFKLMENIISLAEKEGKLEKIKFVFVSNIRGLSKEVMEQMLIDYMRDYGLSRKVIDQIIKTKDGKRLVLDRPSLRQIGDRMNTKDVYDIVIGMIKDANQVTEIEVTILTDNERRWKEREKLRQILWVILAPPKKGEMLSTAMGLAVAIEGKVSKELIGFIRENYEKEEAERLINVIIKDNKVILPAMPARKYLDRIEMERKIYKIQV